jgi:hypothetical protein
MPLLQTTLEELDQRDKGKKLVNSHTIDDGGVRRRGANRRNRGGIGNGIGSIHTKRNMVLVLGIVLPCARTTYRTILALI